MWVGDLAAAINTVDADWLRDQRSDMTWGSKGVLADVKFGGLRRDLSLAFEMDGADEVEDATKFNQQEGVFVGGTDRFASPFQVPGMPAPERYCGERRMTLELRSQAISSMRMQCSEGLPGGRFGTMLISTSD